MYLNKVHKIHIGCNNSPNFIFLLLVKFQYLYSRIKIFNFKMLCWLMNFSLVSDKLMSTLKMAVNPMISFISFFLAKG